MPSPEINKQGEIAHAEFKLRMLLDDAKEKGFEYVAYFKDMGKKVPYIGELQFFKTAEEIPKNRISTFIEDPRLVQFLVTPETLDSILFVKAGNVLSVSKDGRVENKSSRDS